MSAEDHRPPGTGSLTARSTSTAAAGAAARNADGATGGSGGAADSVRPAGREGPYSAEVPYGAEELRGGESQADQESGDEAQGEGARRRMMLSFDAFDASHHRLWLRYAHTQAGSREAARQIVEDACRHLLEHWEHALRQESLTEYAWTVLKEHVAHWLKERGLRPRLAETAAFHAAVRKSLLHELRDELRDGLRDEFRDGLRDEIAVLEGEMGLYAAIGRLPERQYDVVVLRYVLGCSEEEVAGFLGFETASVRSHIRYAKRKLARELRTAPGPGTGDG
jgi:RNA polymerase sigma factor (sigma-70 family)